jgi:hypothetical protein
VPALDQRFGWSRIPLGIVVIGDVLVAIGFYLISLVFRENTFTSATIEIAENQSVISTGPYAIVRHPMYASALLYLAGTPLALGSYWGLVPIAAMIPFLIWRLFDEERFLSRDLLVMLSTGGVYAIGLCHSCGRALVSGSLFRILPRESVNRFYLLRITSMYNELIRFLRCERINFYYVKVVDFCAIYFICGSVTPLYPQMTQISQIKEKTR